MFLIVPRDTLSCCFPLNSFIQNFKYERKQGDEKVPYKLGLCFIYKVQKFKGLIFIVVVFYFSNAICVHITSL